MRNAFRFLLGLLLIVPVFAERDIGTIEKTFDNKPTAVSVTSSSAELQNLALTAFNTHGAFKLVTSGGAYAINFSPIGAAQVSVAITKGGSPVLTQTVSGANLRNALLKAADVAVNKI